MNNQEPLLMDCTLRDGSDVIDFQFTQKDTFDLIQKLSESKIPLIEVGHGPLIDLPVVSIMQSKYGAHKEYHTSADDLNFISPKGLEGAYDIYLKAIEVLELNKVFTPKIMCEPQLGKRNLYEITSDENPNSLINLIAYIDGKLDLMDLSEIINEDFFECHRVAQKLLENDLIF